MTNKKGLFTSLNPNKVLMYICGITPYDTTHVGHAFTYIFFDTLTRYLRYKKYKVIYTQNVTDINDRDNDILKRAREENISWQELSEYWTDRFLSDMQKLNWIMPDNYLKASEQIDGMIKLIEMLIGNNIAYEVLGSVYLDISRVKDFGRLSKFSHDQMLEKAKEFEEDIENKEKRNPLDITLWRAAREDQSQNIPSFDSPFGKGRPGWHIECSAMAISSLGDQVDIHGGGIDLIYPHHESEIAQSEGATAKKPFARFWVHTAPVLYRGKKMSKSLGNLMMMYDLLKKFSAQSIRLYLLHHNYREQWEYNEDELFETDKKISTMKNNFQDVNKSSTSFSRSIDSREKNNNTNQDGKSSNPEVSQTEGPRGFEKVRDKQKNVDKALLKQFNMHMENDMDTKGAINYIFDLSKKAESSVLHRSIMSTCLSILGISF